MTLLWKKLKKNNWEVSFVDGNLDATTQLNGIQDLVNDDVDVMVISTWYIDAMEDVFTTVCGQRYTGFL